MPDEIQQVHSTSNDILKYMILPPQDMPEPYNSTKVHFKNLSRKIEKEFFLNTTF